MSKKRIPKIVDKVEHWRCTRCNNYFPKNNFYKDKRSSIGIKSECKKCHQKTSIESRDPNTHRITNRKWMRHSGYGKRPEVKERERMRSKRRSKSLQAKCRDICNDAIRNGILLKPSICEGCYQEKFLESHHDSYYWPLRVKWFCSLCHAEYHRKHDLTKY